MKLHLLAGGLVLLSIISFSSCETDDVEPKITLSLSAPQINISENLGSTSIVLELNSPAEEIVRVELFASGTAVKDLDYSLTSNVIEIAPGNLSGSVVLTAIQDSLKEGNESVNLSFSSISGAADSGTNSVEINIEDDDVAPVAQIIINEVLYDPATGAAGDANGDGNRDPLEDEFIEFINLSTQDFDLGGFKVYDADGLSTSTPRHVFAPNTIIPAGKALVLFGGGTPTGSFGGAVVVVSSTNTINASNNGDVMTLTDSSGVQIVSFDITPLSNNPDESYTRNPDITGEFEQHTDNTLLLFSPGTKIDGTSF